MSVSCWALLLLSFSNQLGALQAVLDRELSLSRATALFSGPMV